MASKIGLIKGFVQGAVWSGKAGQRVLLPFQDTVLEAAFTYGGELVEAMTFSDQGVLGTSQSCLQSEECGVTMSTEDLSWSFLQAATLSTAQTRTDPVLVTESFTLSEVDTGNSTFAISDAIDTSSAATLDLYGLDTDGISVADIDGNQIPATVSGQTITLDADYTGQTVTAQYTRAALSDEEVIYLGSGARRQTVGVYGRFFGCPGTLLIVVPKAAVQPGLEFGVSGGSVASLGLNLKAIRQNGYFAEITRLS